ncbi:hypothetical protein [Pseudomonas sp. stari2]|uniref:hypothetical protein n=1 Tax=Pseudomonas sp. Stari2 TaxID=2954814 RepID=UPI00345E04D7
MKVFDIVKPGTNIVLQGFSDEERHRVESLVFAITRAFETAAVALEMFKTASAESRLIVNSREEFQYRRARTEELRKELDSKSIAAQLDLDAMHKRDNEITRLFLVEQWRKGEVPSAFKSHKVAIVARAFIFALDEFEKCLKKLTKKVLPGWNGLAKVYDEMLAEFGSVYDVRNTAHHLEDRILGQNRHGDKIVPGGGVFIENFDGSRYMTLLENGQQGYVDISDESMDRLGAVLISFYACFTWDGRESLLVY